MRLSMKCMQYTLATALLATVAMAGGTEDFTLTKAIPADSFIAVHARSHEGMEFVNAQYARVWEEIKKVRFDKDIKRMFKAMQQEQLPPDTQLEGFEEQWQQMYDLATAVDWASLGKRESAFAMKLGFPMHETVLLFMPPADQIDESFDGLHGVAKKLAEMAPELLTCAEQEDGEAKIVSLAFVNAPFPLNFTLARHGEVIMIGFGVTMPEQTLALLRGEGESLSATPRFKAAFEKLPAPTDEMTYFDTAKFFTQLRGVIDGAVMMASASAPAEGEEGYAEFKQWSALPGKILKEFDIFDYSAAVVTTQDKLRTTDAYSLLREDAASTDFYKVLTNNKPSQNPLKYIPADAGEFAVWNGIDLNALWQMAVRIIENDVPDGASVMAEIRGAKETTGWDIDADVFGWIGGGFQTFSIPGPTPYSPAEFVFMMSVKDEAKANEILGRIYAMLEPVLMNQNGMIIDAEIEGAEGFKSVVFPVLAMVGLSKPTLGVADGWLMLGSSPDIIKKTMQIAAGEGENFSANERYQKEGIPANGDVVSLSFSDMTKLGEELGQILQMAPMIGMAAPEIMKDPKMQSILSIVSKTGRVVRKLDFFQSTSSRTTFSDNAFRTKSVLTYREPPAPPQKPTPPKKPEPPTSEPKE